MAMLEAKSVSRFIESFAGSVFLPGDSGFAESRAAAVWNGDITRQPGLIVQPRSAQEVAAVVDFVRAEGAELTIRGGGHGFAGNAVREGAVMLDLSQLAGVSVDAPSRRARVGGGASWAVVDAAAAEHGLAVVGGTISHTGVAGLTLGGGMGWLTRAQGLSADNLVGATVVTADGRIVTASADSNPDLFWALRGGGGNFGVVTEFVFALHEVNPLANLGLFFWRPEEAREPLQFARNYLLELPEQMGCILAGMSAPPAPFVPAEFHGVAGFALLVVSWGSAEEHAAAVQPLRDRSPLFELVTPIPYVALQQMLDESAPWGALGYEKALYLEDLSDAVIDVAIDHLPRKLSPLSFMPVFPLGGAFAAVADDATAFGGSRSTRWVFNIAAVCPDPALIAADRTWVREFWDALRPHAADGGTYVNFLVEADQDRVRASYGETKYAKLAKIKAEWDPQNMFRFNANIRPGAAVSVPAQQARSEELHSASKPA